ncbi:MAG: DUF1573 domain-containing protein [Candidatus Campbellbacteria bacterium]|nr:DUF1573 domain-containing protein [Candidatus Campbellbacteria bacterium]
MKPQTVIITVLAFATVIGLLVVGYNKNGNAAASVQGVSAVTGESGLTVSETLYDFGTISMKNGNVTKDFTLTNPTDADIMVGRVETSCMCTAAYIVEPDGTNKGPFGMPGHGGAVPPANEIIPAGESRIIRVVYDPNAHGPAGVGKIDRFITITDSANQSIRIEVKAVVTP